MGSVERKIRIGSKTCFPFRVSAHQLIKGASFCREDQRGLGGLGKQVSGLGSFSLLLLAARFSWRLVEMWVKTGRHTSEVSSLRETYRATRYVQRMPARTPAIRNAAVSAAARRVPDSPMQASIAGGAICASEDEEDPRQGRSGETRDCRG